MSSRRAIIVRLPGSADQAVHFNGAELNVGRSPDNDVCLPDRGVSRRHARIYEQGGLWVESATQVASLVQHGQPVVRCRLDAGPVGVGPYTLSLEGAEADGRLAAPGEGAQARSALLAKIVEALDLRLPASRYLESLLDTLLGYLQAERAFLFRFDATGKIPQQTMMRCVGGADAAVGVSVSTILKAASARAPQLILDLAPMESAIASASLQALALGQTSSIIASPLITGPRMLGVLYLDSRSSLKCFSPEDLSLLESVSATIARVIDGFRMRDELEASNDRLWGLLEEAEPEGVPAERLVAADSPARREIDLCRAAAPKDVSVLLLGETGTGKDVLARLIHRHSGRASGPFTAINCAALPESLIEAELFGVKKGAYTGADQDRPGVVELADNGTLFLDEIGELTQAAQAKLLKVLQDRVVTRIGETRERPVNFRLVAATLRDLDRAIQEGRFRRDLFYRINVLSVKLTPLRERKQDIPLIAAHVLRTLAPRLRSAATAIDAGALAALQAYDWPGNIRELRNVIERSLVFCPGRRIERDHLPPEIATRGAARAGGASLGAAPADSAAPVADPPRPDADWMPYEDALRSFELDYFRALVTRTGFNVAAMARLSNLTRPTVYRRLARLGLESPTSAEPGDEE